MKNKKIKIISVVGIRPNFVKIAPLVEEFKRHKEIKHILVHTGQHVDIALSKVFFEQLRIPKPDINLGIGKSTLESRSKVKKGITFILNLPKLFFFFCKEKPDLVIVVGDATSTLFAAVAAKIARCKIAHVEAGLRSFNRKMPEEFNRKWTDKLSDFLFTTEESANKNLKKEKVKGKIFFVGNIMIDTLRKNLKKAIESRVLKKLNLKPKKYTLLTLHRTENIDNKKVLSEILDAIDEISKHIKIVFPLHPRTKKKIEDFGLANKLKNIFITDPLSYLDFLCLEKNAKFVLTDSGGAQEETTFLKVPCLTLRTETERPVTVKKGTNIICGIKREKIIRESLKILKGKIKKGKIPDLWDGKTAERIPEVILRQLK